MKKALITGITGQDGSYLAEFLLDKGYEVHGLVRMTSVIERKRLRKLERDIVDSVTLRMGDITDYEFVKSLLEESRPEEIYHLAAQSNVGKSLEIPEETKNINYGGVSNLIKAIMELQLNPKLFHASTAEIFGDNGGRPINEETTVSIKNPYAESKLQAHKLIVEYRQNKGMFACNGILFNHESPRRGENFVTRKITQNLARIKLGIQEKMDLGNINAERDWGYAKEYVEAMWLMLQQEKPEDYVIGTGKKHSVRDFIETTAEAIGLNIHSNNEEGINEKYLDENGEIRIEINPEFFRPKEINTRIADNTKIRQIGWSPKTEFKELVKIMVEADIAKEKEHL